MFIQSTKKGWITAESYYDNFGRQISTKDGVYRNQISWKHEDGNYIPDYLFFNKDGMPSESKKHTLITAKEEIKYSYFRRIYIDGRQWQIRTMNPVPHSIAQKTECYKVYYYNNGKIKSYSKQQNGKTVKLEKNVFSVFFTYTDSTETREYRNLSENLTPNKNGVEKTILFLTRNINPYLRLIMTNTEL